MEIVKNLLNRLLKNVLISGVTTPVTLPSSLLHRKIVMCSTLIEPQFPMNLMYNFFGLSQFEKIDLNMCSHLNFVDLELSKLKGITLISN